MWMFFKQLSFDIESDDFPDRSVEPSLPDAHRLPDILRFGGVFRCDLKAVSAKKRPSSWALPQFSGQVVTKLTNFLKHDRFARCSRKLHISSQMADKYCSTDSGIWLLLRRS